MAFRSEFLQRLESRGFLHQCTDLEGLDALLCREVVTGYIGFDLTADSLHVGSLYPLMLLKHLQESGHRPIVLFGGGTTKVGDPSGKDESRPVLTEERIAANKAGLKRVFSKFVRFEGENAAIEVDNGEWLEALNYISFLREVGRHFSVNRMLTFDSVKQRLEREQPLSFIEFNYMILQGYDFVELEKRYGCRLQMGASDQWGNIVNGVELYRRMRGEEGVEGGLFGLTCPLLVDGQGKKMGKSANGAVWLDEEKVSAYDFWQFWRNTEDGDVTRFLRLFTELPLEEVDRLGALGGAEVNEAKKVLATEVTALVHGRAAAEEAARIAKETFELGGSAAGLPTVLVSEAELGAGIRVAELMVRAGFADSNGAAKRLIKGGGVRVNDAKVEDEAATLDAEALAGGEAKLSVGKKNHALVRRG